MKKWLLAFSAMLLLCSYGFADVIWLNDGRIFFGEIESADSDGIIINTFGETRKVANSDINKSEKTLDNLKSSQVDILLKDGSVLKGKIQNYDSEIGVLIETDLGPNTIPVTSIKEIYDPAKKKLYTGFPFTIGVIGGYYIPVTGLASDFNNSYNFSIFGEYNAGFIRGVSFGAEISSIMIDYKVDDSDFSIYSFQPYVSYRFLQLKKSQSFVKIFTPFISAGIGGAYIIKENSSDQESEIDAIGNVKLGLDISITESLGFRVYASDEAILQSSSVFNRVLFNAGLIYSF